MIGPLLKKDARLLWPMVVLVTAIQVALDAAVHVTGLFGDSAVAAELLRPLTLAWFSSVAALTVAVVQQDPIPGVDQDWLVRPLRRRDLLLEKLVFLILAIAVPMLVVNLVQALAMGFSAPSAFLAMTYKEAYVFAFLVVPVLALAATARNMTDLALLAAALMVVYAAGAALSTLIGANRCPTCGTGLEWEDHLLQHLGVCVGALAVAILQYRRRRTTLARVLVVCGAFALAFAHLPWSMAFWLQQRAVGPRAAAAIEIAPAAASTVAPLTIELPLRVSGIGAREMLLVDRAVAELSDADGRLLYRGVEDDLQTRSLNPGDGVAHAELHVPTRLAKSAAQPVQVRMNYSLTLMDTVATYPMAALDGTLRSPEMGVCGTRLEGDNVVLRCKQLGRAASCFSATLVGEDGARNPEVMRCQPDYRPYLPAFTQALGFEGADLPVHDRYELAHYAVSGAALEHAVVMLKIYAVRAHFQRSVSTVASISSPDYDESWQ